MIISFASARAIPFEIRVKRGHASCNLEMPLPDPAENRDIFQVLTLQVFAEPHILVRKITISL